MKLRNLLPRFSRPTEHLQVRYIDDGIIISCSMSPDTFKRTMRFLELYGKEMENESKGD